MNHPEDLEKRFDAFEDETNHNLTMLLGHAWKQTELLRSVKTVMRERFDRIDDRVSEAHKEVAELHQHMATKEDLSRFEARLTAIEATMATKQDLADMKQDLFDAIKQLLQ